MLKSQDTNTEAQTPRPSNLGKARVTPQELSAALAAIESRKQAEASLLAGTIPIEDAVSDLHLDSTPEEIWAEVNAQRQKQAQEKLAREQARLAVPTAPKQFIAPARVKNRKWMGIFAPFLLIWVLMQAGVIPNFWHHRHGAAVHTTQFQNLSQVPDGQEFYCATPELVPISKGKPLSQISDFLTEDPGNTWSLVKMGGHVYMHGFIARADALESLQGKAIKVYNDDNSGELQGEATSNITLRVDKVPLQKSGGDDGFSEVTVPNFQPDPLTTLSPWH